MKKMILFLLALTMMCATVSFARTDLKKSKVAFLKQKELVRLCYEGNSTAVVEVTIKDKDGREIFKEEIREQSFIRPYNFSELPVGNYTVDVRDETGNYSETVQYYDRAYLGHIMKLNDDKNKYLVTIPKKGNDEVSVCVFDSEDNLVFSEIANGKQDYAKVYNLKNLAGATIKLFDRN